MNNIYFCDIYESKDTPCLESGLWYTDADITLCKHHAMKKGFWPNQVIRYCIVGEEIKEFSGYVDGGDFKSVIDDKLMTLDNSLCFSNYDLAIDFLIDYYDNRVKPLEQLVNEFRKKSNELILKRIFMENSRGNKNELR